MQSLPHYISTYLKNIGKEQSPVLTATALKNSGNILEFTGKFKQFFDVKPQYGKSIEDLSPFFIGLFPANGDIIEFPKIQTKLGKYLDVFVFITQVEVWFLFYNSSKEAKNMKKLNQERNDQFLEEYRKSKENADK